MKFIILLFFLLSISIAYESKIWGPDCVKSCLKCNGAICGKGPQHCCGIDECVADNVNNPCPNSAKIFVAECTVDPKAPYYCNPEQIKEKDTDKSNNILATNDIFGDPYLAIRLNNPNFYPTGYGDEKESSIPTIMEPEPFVQADVDSVAKKAKIAEKLKKKRPITTSEKDKNEKKKVKKNIFFNKRLINRN